MTLKERFRQIKKFPVWIYWLPSRILFVLRFLMRFEFRDPDGLLAAYMADDSRTAVTVTWHNRLLFFPTLFPKKMRKRTAAVISASRDGQYIADLVSLFGVKSVRGSTSRRAMHVLRDAAKTLRGGHLISFTPDGPRGPKYRMSKGPVHLASMLGVPVIGFTLSFFLLEKKLRGREITQPIVVYHYKEK